MGVIRTAVAKFIYNVPGNVLDALIHLSPQQPFEVHTVIVPILWVRSQSHREVQHPLRPRSQDAVP